MDGQMLPIGLIALNLLVERWYVEKGYSYEAVRGWVSSRWPEEPSRVPGAGKELLGNPVGAEMGP